MVKNLITPGQALRRIMAREVFSSYIFLGQDSFFHELIIDGTDNFPARYLVNDVAKILRIPNVYGSVFRFEGQVSVFAPHLDGPCYRCLFPDPPAPGAVPD